MAAHPARTMTASEFADPKRMTYLLSSVSKRLVFAAGLVVLAAASAGPLPGQALLGEQRRQATRNELEQMAKAAENAAQTAPDDKTRERIINDANAIRERLRNGDFVPGDRILIQLMGDSSLTDTFTVRGDRMLRLPNLPDISLYGVLDSELKDHLTKEIGKYIKQPELNAVPLLRLAAMGSVGRPGFITVPVDLALADFLMNVGGPAGGSDFKKSVFRRAGEVVVPADDLQEAIRLNRTVGDLSLRDGDELFIPDKSKRPSIFTTLQLITALMGFYFVLTLGRRGGRRGGIGNVP
jgi:hypothetical protein